MIRFGGRKLLVVLLALGMSFTLALLGKLTLQFASVVSVCVGAFMVAHAVQDWHAQPGGGE